MRFDRWPFATLGRRTTRLDAAAEALERATAAADAERARLTEAVAITHGALAVLHDRLLELAEVPARAEAELRAAAATAVSAATDRIADEIAPARAAAEEHAAFLRASLDRLRGETDALNGAEEAAAVLVALAGTAQTGFTDALAGFTRRADQAGEAAERAIERLEAIAARAETPAPEKRSPPRRAALHPASTPVTV
jgi:chromosome segregation ATPase